MISCRNTCSLIRGNELILKYVNLKALTYSIKRCEDKLTFIAIC